MSGGYWKHNYTQVNKLLFHRALTRFVAIRFKSGNVFGYTPSKPAQKKRVRRDILAERGRARLEEDGRRRSVAINPALLDDRE